MSEIDQLIMQWRDVKEAAQSATSLERQLRERLVFLLYGAPDDQPEGTKTHKLGHGYALKATFGRNRKVTGTAEEIADIRDSLFKLGCDEADAVFRRKFELSVGTYKQLSEPARALVNRVILTGPATPTLELVEPKK